MRSVIVAHSGRSFFLKLVQESAWGFFLQPQHPASPAAKSRARNEGRFLLSECMRLLCNIINFKIYHYYFSNSLLMESPRWYPNVQQSLHSRFETDRRMLHACQEIDLPTRQVQNFLLLISYDAWYRSLAYQPSPFLEELF